MMGKREKTHLKQLKQFLQEGEGKKKGRKGGRKEGRKEGREGRQGGREGREGEKVGRERARKKKLLFSLLTVHFPDLPLRLLPREIPVLICLSPSPKPLALLQHLDLRHK